MNMIKRFLFVALLMMATVTLSAQKVNKDDYITSYGSAEGSLSIEKLQEAAYAEACYNFYIINYHEIFEGLIDMYAERDGCSESVKNILKTHWLKVWIRVVNDIEIIDKRGIEDRRDNEVRNFMGIVVGVNRNKMGDILNNVGNYVTETEKNQLMKEKGALEQFTACNTMLIERCQKMYKLN